MGFITPVRTFLKWCFLQAWKGAFQDAMAEALAETSRMEEQVKSQPVQLDWLAGLQAELNGLTHEASVNRMASIGFAPVVSAEANGQPKAEPKQSRKPAISKPKRGRPAGSKNRKKAA